MNICIATTIRVHYGLLLLLTLLFVWLKLLQNVAADVNDIMLLSGGTVSQMLGCVHLIFASNSSDSHTNYTR